MTLILFEYSFINIFLKGWIDYEEESGISLDVEH